MKKLLIDRFPTHYLPGVGRQVMAVGGEVEGDVSFLEETPDLPTFARPETQAVTRALDAARRPEPEMRAYEPTLREKAYNFVAGTDSARPSVERSNFAHGVADILGLTPGVGQAMQAQEAVRADDNKALAMAVLPGPAGRAGAVADEAATNIAQRATNPLGMHSRAAEVARALPQQQGTLEQMLAMIKKQPGVNPEELHWAGVTDAFQPGSKVSAEDLAKHFEAKLPQTQEKLFGYNPRTREIENRIREVENLQATSRPYHVVNRETGELSRPFNTQEEAMAHLDTYVGPEREKMSWTRRPDMELEREYLALHDELDRVSRETEAPHYNNPDYNAPHGIGENYREVVLHHPLSMAEAPGGVRRVRWPSTLRPGEFNESTATLSKIRQMKDAGIDVEDLGPHIVEDYENAYRAPHFEGMPNIVGHLRMSDRVTPEGQRILNVHELQSDWGQQARTLGVRRGDPEAEKTVLQAQFDQTQQVMNQTVEEAKVEAAAKLRGANLDEMEVRRMLDRMSPYSIVQMSRGEQAADEYIKMMEGNSQLWDDINAVGRRVPAAPYVTSREGSHNTPGWTDLLIKRILQEAEKGGYDRVVWDSGHEQAKRWEGAHKAAKGMLGYYNDILPKRFAKVIPEAKLQQYPWEGHGAFMGADDIGDWAARTMNYRPYGDALASGLEPEQALRATGLYDQYILDAGRKARVENPLPAIEVARSYEPEGGFDVMYTAPNGEGVHIGKFDSIEEADAAKLTFAADLVRKELDKGAAFNSKPGFDIDDALRERIRKGFPAYRKGGEVEYALTLARSSR